MTRPFQQIADQIAKAVRPFAPGGKLWDGDVVLINALADAFHKRQGATATAPTRPKLSLRHPTALTDPKAFYAALRSSLFKGGISQSQLDGIEALLVAMGSASWPIAWAAYGIETAYHETAYTMQPVREAYWLSEEWRKKNLRYWPWYGRGYVQITWQENYERADRELDLGGKLIANKDLALQPDVAAAILVKGMSAGWFCKDAKGPHNLARHLPTQGRADIGAFAEARRIINGTDKARKMAAEAIDWQAALLAGGWR